MRIGAEWNVLRSLLVFVGAFLLFVVQPMAGKGLLPRWGGSAGVWTACLLFFQIGLLIGYAYARGSVRFLSPRGQSMAQAALMIAAMAWLVLPWGAEVEVAGPAMSVLASLAMALALPSVALSSSSPMASQWEHASQGGREPYFLYAVSNAGSLAGCLAYPFAVEPYLAFNQQQWAWRAIFVVWAVGWLVACLRVFAAPTRELPSLAANAAHASSEWGQWLVLPCSTAIVLAASTQNLSQAGVVVPGLWVLPLAIYLATWWIAFGGWGPKGWGGQAGLFYAGAAVALVLVIFKLWLPWISIIAGYSLVMFCIGLACHGLLYELRPHAGQVTGYYLAIASGGALGTAGALWIAPLWFNDFYELHVGLALGAVAIASFYLQRLTPRLNSDAWVRRWSWPMNIIAPCVLLGGLWTQAFTRSVERTIDQRRDFYGMVKVIENPKRGYRAMVLGQTIHGVEPLEGDLDLEQSMYYGTRSGAALAWGWTRERLRRPLRVGAIGLGTGTMSLYAAREDHLIYYEISPAVRDMAQQHFRYLASHRGATDLRIGDGRVVIAQEVAEGAAESEPMDLLLIDAFTNDSLPMHLLTVEAMQTYRRRLRADGVIALNITNRNLDLAPILMATAKRAGYQGVLIEHAMQSPEAAAVDRQPPRQVRWMLCVPDSLTVPAWPGMRTNLRNQAEPWTDAYGSLLHAFRW